jgi:hypothetical protein
MQKLISFATLLVCLTLVPGGALAGWFSSDTLVTLNGTDYDKEEFKQWWKFWQEKDQKLPETPDFYVDWLLLKEEAERMDIANAPGFKRQERIFLQSRGLLMLKYEEVDSRIKVTDEQIQARYQERYVPRWLVQQLTFADEEAALAAWKQLDSGSLTVAELVGESDAEAGDAPSAMERWLRPKLVDPGWAKIFQQTPVGQVVDPQLHQQGKQLFYIKASDAGGEDDLAAVREEIRKTLWREQEDQLTAKLLDELWDQYQVEIDRERLAALDLNAEDSSFGDAPVITTSKENVSEKQFIAVVRRLQQDRPAAMMALTDKEKAQDFKLETAKNIINQSVTNWGTLDRHFEKEEPFKSVYQFNYNYRLVKMLENQLFSLKAEPTEEELTELYQEKGKFYKVPAQVKLYILDETRGPIGKIWAEVAVGKPFTAAAKELLGHAPRAVETPLNHLDPQVREVVDKLAEGETSQLFEARGDRVLVHLVSRSPERTPPLEKIRDSLINGYQRESFDRARAEYLQQLKANARIDVNQKVWKSIRKELGGA